MIRQLYGIMEFIEFNKNVLSSYNYKLLIFQLRSLKF